MEHAEYDTRTKNLELWRDGVNGAKGAEDRLQAIEWKVTGILIMVGILFGQEALSLLMGVLL